MRIAILTGCLALAGCNIGCTEMGCLGRVLFDIDPAAVSADADTAYVFYTSVDGSEDVCEGIIGESFDCTGTWVVALDADNLPTAVWTNTGGRLATVALDIERDGQTVFSEVFDADGAPFFPNGRRCGGACESFETLVSW